MEIQLPENIIGKTMYLTVEELKTYNIDVFDGKSDEELENLIDLYASLVEEHCNTKFNETEHSFKVDVARKISVMHTPLVSVKSITYKNQPLISDEQYYVYEDRNLIELEDTSTFIQRKKTLVVNYMYGFKKTPASVKKAIIDLVKLHIDGSGSNSLISQESYDSEYSYTKNTQKTPQQLQQDILSTLDNYKQKQYKPMEDSDGDVVVRLI